MSVLDVESLLAECSPDSPCGEDLEYDAAFGEMERAAESKPEQQYGDTIIPAEEPDWKDVKRHGLEMSKRSKDLRVAVLLARALLHQNGLTAFKEGLQLIAGYVSQYWDGVHPQLDPDDDNDPTLRINVVASLCDVPTTLNEIRHAPIVQSRALGRFSLLDVQIAKGEEPAGSGEAPKLDTINAAFTDSDLDELQETEQAVVDAIEAVGQMEESITKHVGSSAAVSMDKLSDMLQRIRKFLEEQLHRRGADSSGDVPEVADAETPAADGAEGAAPADAGSPAAAAAPQVPRLTGEIHSREDVIKALDKICDYYERHEPSSPLPLLINRAKRLASKSFLEIIQDLTPEALGQAKALGGIEDQTVSGGGGEEYVAEY